MLTQLGCGAAAFMGSLRHKMVLFRNAKRDDRCDGLSQALNFIIMNHAKLERPPGVRAPGRPRSHLRTARRTGDDLLCRDFGGVSPGFCRYLRTT